MNSIIYTADSDPSRIPLFPFNTCPLGSLAANPGFFRFGDTKYRMTAEEFSADMTAYVDRRISMDNLRAYHRRLVATPATDKLDLVLERIGNHSERIRAAGHWIYPPSDIKRVAKKQRRKKSHSLAAKG